jgi:hypothetical protein
MNLINIIGTFHSYKVDEITGDGRRGARVCIEKITEVLQIYVITPKKIAWST